MFKSAYDFHKGYDSRWYVTWNGKALYAYPHKRQAVGKFITIRRAELMLARDYMEQGGY